MEGVSLSDPQKNKNKKQLVQQKPWRRRPKQIG